MFIPNAPKAGEGLYDRPQSFRSKRYRLRRTRPQQRLSAAIPLQSLRKVPHPAFGPVWDDISTLG
jgi:hypothetical protein